MERVKNYISERILPSGAENLFMDTKEFEKLLMVYGCAIREVTTKLEVLNEELSVSYNRNPIEFIKTRVKKPVSILKKLETKGYEVSLESIEKNLDDVAGVRVICCFIDDIYDIARWLAKQDDICLVEVKDYIRHPKENGYRSLHMIVEIPVFFSEEKRPVRVEVQIRTIAMDFWASLEHQLRYKKNIENTQDISRDLKECAETIAQTDLKMQEIRERIGVFTELT